jgi:C4-type Zn-finger protein
VTPKLSGKLDARAPRSEIRCESCGGLYDFDQVEVRDIPPIVPGEIVERMLVCDKCVKRFDTMSAGQDPCT